MPRSSLARLEHQEHWVPSATLGTGHPTELNEHPTLGMSAHTRPLRASSISDHT